jgi:hypothetical protein
MAELSLASAWRKPLWIALLVLASVVFSLGFACAVPLAAFAAIAALALSRRDAFALVGAVWYANQIAGFAIHHYPMTPSTFAWGAALGAVALASTLAAQWATERLPQVGGTVAAAAFLAAFAVYEGSLLAISLFIGSGISNFTPSIVKLILSINVAPSRRFTCFTASASSRGSPRSRPNPALPRGNGGLKSLQICGSRSRLIRRRSSIRLLARIRGVLAGLRGQVISAIHFGRVEIFHRKTPR